MHRPAVGLALAVLVAASAQAAFPTGDSTQTMEFGGRTRQYLVHVPSKYDGTAAVPLVLDFHGFTSNATQQRGISGMVAISDREGFLLVHPDGVNNAWNAGMCCPGAAPDDLEFVRAVVAAVSSQANVDASRVYATGLSNGGAMSQRLACDAADLFAASAPMAFPVPFKPLSQCHPVRPMPVLTFMGLVDVLVAYDGLVFPSAAATQDFWHDVNGCDGATPDAVVVRGASRCETFTSCRDGVESGLCSITAATFGGSPFDGHILYVNDDFVLSEVAWAFLSRFRLPAKPAAFRTGKLTGTLRLRRRGERTSSKDATWTVGFGHDTWWATDADARPFAGASTGKSRRKLVFTTDAATSLAAAIAERLGVEAASVTVDGDPTLRATVGKRARVGGVVRFGGATSGTLTVKLAGRLTP
jgi:polyhydroxybutyrate depolymerase